jgi:hypothetical protein
MKFSFESQFFPGYWLVPITMPVADNLNYFSSLHFQPCSVMQDIFSNVKQANLVNCVYGLVIFFPF